MPVIKAKIGIFAYHYFATVMVFWWSCYPSTAFAAPTASDATHVVEPSAPTSSPPASIQPSGGTDGSAPVDDAPTANTVDKLNAAVELQHPPNAAHTHFDEIYDQRQNGSENYHVRINGVMVAITPPETLLATALLLSDPMFQMDDESRWTNKPNERAPVHQLDKNPNLKKLVQVVKVLRSKN